MAHCRQGRQGGRLGSCHSASEVMDRNKPAPGKGRRAFQAKGANVQSPQGGTKPSLFKDLQDHCLDPGRGAPGQGWQSLQELLGFILAVGEGGEGLELSSKGSGCKL